MKELIAQFPNQLEEALSIGNKNKIKLPQTTYNQVYISGLGGSGIGASIVQDFVNDKLVIPLVVNKTYHIAKSVNETTLFIACSYSGNTEETIQAFQEARKKRATIICIASGGLLIDLAQKFNIPYFLIPSGNPPRASLGYSLVQILFVLKYAGLISSSFEKEINGAIQFLKANTGKLKKKGEVIAKQIGNKYVVVYTTIGQEGLAVRFRQQLNENSKQLAWHNVIPEMTHNEIVGWTKTQNDLHIIYAFPQNEEDKIIKRLNYLKQVIKKYKCATTDIMIVGDNYWERAFYFIHLTDWISVHLADLNQRDATEVKVIDGLKATMAKK